MMHGNTKIKPIAQVTFLQTKRTTAVTVDSFPQSWCLYFVWLHWMLYFSLQVAPQTGSIVYSGILIHLLKFLCPVFCNNLHSFLFHSDWTAIFFLCSLVPVFSLSVVKSTYWGSFNEETLTSCNKELLQSEVFEYEINTWWIIRVGVWATSFRWWFSVWWSSSITFPYL